MNRLQALSALSGIGLTCLLISGLTAESNLVLSQQEADSLRATYSKPTGEWPRPWLDSGVVHRELGTLPKSPLSGNDSLKPMIELGKTLFFDPRLSGSGQISCATCHDPERSFTDNRSISLGHDQQAGTRNAPSLLNIWAMNRLFWDGRSNSLEEQSQSPIGNNIEMHQNLDELPKKLRQIKGYQPLFASAFGSDKIDTKRVATALATYQRTLVGRKSRFDQFLAGNSTVMSNEAIQGLHLFRTKARCINCHNGPLFSDGDFHNIGLTYYQRPFEDLGRYNITKKPADVGRFRTPSLREVMLTRPWMHNGLFDDMEGIINMYNAGGAKARPKGEQVNDPLYPKLDPLLKPLHLTPQERESVVAFLQTLTTNSYRVERPVMPK